MEKIKIYTKEQLDKIASENQTYVDEYPLTYPCVLIFVEFETRESSYYGWYYVYPSDF